MPEKKTIKKKASKTKAAPAKKAAATKKAAPAKKAAAKKTPAAKKPASNGFSLEDAISIAKTTTEKPSTAAEKKAEKEKQQQAIEAAEKKAEKRVLGAASLADILGAVAAPVTNAGPPLSRGRSVPRKHEKFFNLLMELRNHVSEGLSLHAEETLKRSAKDDAGDLSGYSQHMADAGTDTFDRDFALSMVSSEQEALSEVDAAIERIYKGTYGTCEMTGKQIRDERLMAVPFTRYSMASQAQLEKGKVRSVQRGGIFAESASDNPMGLTDEDSDN